MGEGESLNAKKSHGKNALAKEYRITVSRYLSYGSSGSSKVPNESDSIRNSQVLSVNDAVVFQRLALMVRPFSPEFNRPTNFDDVADHLRA